VFGDYLLARGDVLLRCKELFLHDGQLATVLRSHAVITVPPRILEEPGQCVMLVGPGYEIYGHWLVDFLPKLHLLRMGGHDLASLKFLIPSSTPEFGTRWLEFLGIRPAQLIRYEPFFDRVRVEQLLIPTVVRTNSRVSPVFAAAVGGLKELMPHAGGDRPAYPSRIFISRAKANRHARWLNNRERIETMAQESGFTIVHPEHMTLLEQMQLFAGAREIIGEYGSALHGSIFAPAGTVVCALRGTKSPVAGFLQSAIGDALQQPTGYVFGETQDDPLESFTVDEADFQLCLRLLESAEFSATFRRPIACARSLRATAP